MTTNMCFFLLFPSPADGCLRVMWQSSGTADALNSLCICHVYIYVYIYIYIHKRCTDSTDHVLWSRFSFKGKGATTYWMGKRLGGWHHLRNGTMRLKGAATKLDAPPLACQRTFFDHQTSQSHAEWQVMTMMFDHTKQAVKFNNLCEFAVFPEPIRRGIEVMQLLGS